MNKNILDSTLKNLKYQTQHPNLVDVGYKTTFILFSSFKIMFAMKNIDWIGISCRYKEMNVSLLEKKSPRLILPIFPICSFQIVSRTFHIAQSYKTIGTLVYVIYVDHPVSKSISVKSAARITVLVEIN